ncbi:Glutathione S-transferase sigma [Aphelenchoides fujianensis]|nr:Glutathione S-transferase sigma [Aphelenchoides fujianensis]
MLEPAYKLFYFDCRNLGETARMILRYAQDVRIDLAEWPQLKSTFPFGTLPVLEEDGRQLGESCAIARYLGRKYGLGGRDEWEEAKVDELMEYQRETYELLKPYLLSAGV